MKSSEKPRGRLLVALAQSTGALFFLAGAIKYLATGDLSGSFYFMFVGFGLAWFARQCFDFYNLRPIRFFVERLIKKHKEKKRIERHGS